MGSVHARPRPGGDVLGRNIDRNEVQQVRIGVFGLFHPQRLALSSSAGGLLECASEREKWKASGLRLELSGARIKVTTEGKTDFARQVRCQNSQGSPGRLVLAVPGKIERAFEGVLEIQPHAQELLAVVGMELETAVASVVAAEELPNAPIESLKAQAVAARSFFSGGSRHDAFDFCDTTHCQFLRAPPDAHSPAARAAQSTRGLTLAYRGATVAALYSASCGGQTHSLEELGLPVRGYPYFSVVCDYCRRHPQPWASRLQQSDAQTLRPSERSRLALARKLGWNAIPSNSYSAQRQGASVLLEGTGAGHGIGLCQRGSTAMAREGATFQEILRHYYPNTVLTGK